MTAGRVSLILQQTVIKSIFTTPFTLLSGDTYISRRRGAIVAITTWPETRADPDTMIL